MAEHDTEDGTADQENATGVTEKAMSLRSANKLQKKDTPHSAPKTKTKHTPQPTESKAERIKIFAQRMLVGQTSAFMEDTMIRTKWFNTVSGADVKTFLLAMHKEEDNLSASYIRIGECLYELRNITTPEMFDLFLKETKNNTKIIRFAISLARLCKNTDDGPAWRTFCMNYSRGNANFFNYASKMGDLEREYLLKKHPK